MRILIYVRVANVPDDMLDGLTPRKRRYYLKQASKVANILNHRIMQSLLMKVIESEDIDPDDIQDVRVMVLPSVGDKRHRNHLYGCYDEDVCQISIYPAVKYRGSRFLTDPMASFQFIKESFDTVIHEVLHAKYKDELTVRKLTRKYLELFFKLLRKYFEE